jgi:hypothetical protein
MRILFFGFEFDVVDVQLLCFVVDVVDVTSRLDEQQGTQRTGNTSVDVVNVGGVR